jgi:hypoxanthine phosphoribosyltransferase
VLRTFLKTKNHKNIPIQAIGLSLYEELGTFTTEEKIGREVVRTQWLDFSTLGATCLLGKKILIVVSKSMEEFSPSGMRCLC